MSLERHGKTGAASRFTEEATWVAAAAGAGATAAGAFLAASFNSSTLRFKAAFWNPGKHGTRRQWAICRRKRTRKRDRQRRQTKKRRGDQNRTTRERGAGGPKTVFAKQCRSRKRSFCYIGEWKQAEEQGCPLGPANQQWAFDAQPIATANGHIQRSSGGNNAVTRGGALPVASGSSGVALECRGKDSLGEFKSKLLGLWQDPMAAARRPTHTFCVKLCCSCSNTSTLSCCLSRSSRRAERSALALLRSAACCSWYAPAPAASPPSAVAVSSDLVRLTT